MHHNSVLQWLALSWSWLGLNLSKSWSWYNLDVTSRLGLGGLEHNADNLSKWIRWECRERRVPSLVGSMFVWVSSTERAVELMSGVKKRKCIQAIFIKVSTVRCLKRGKVFPPSIAQCQVSAGLPKGTYLILYSRRALGAKSQSPLPWTDLVLTGGFGALWPGLKHFCQSEEKQHHCSCNNTRTFSSEHYKKKTSYGFYKLFEALKSSAVCLTAKNADNYLMFWLTRRVKLQHTILSGCVWILKVNVLCGDRVSHSPKAFIGSDSLRVKVWSLGSSLSMRATS